MPDDDAPIPDLKKGQPPSKWDDEDVDDNDVKDSWEDEDDEPAPVITVLLIYHFITKFCVDMEYLGLVIITLENINHGSVSCRLNCPIVYIILFG